MFTFVQSYNINLVIYVSLCFEIVAFEKEKHIFSITSSITTVCVSSYISHIEEVIEVNDNYCRFRQTTSAV